ncbi:MAG TPA: VanW family protein [Candidatus Avipropionibacterium avicola]|uniref:VanW family protein n=1 Tax=Candidatus Avipropionibacterium avicola TaxID=2840701 RepID=A0A9D1GXL2_9ACTN|nr:VanW family protein [Candidatus Avipropionibacterium avicola]
MSSEETPPDSSDSATESLDTTGAAAATGGAASSRRGPAKVILITLIGLLVIVLGTYGVGFAIAGDRTPRDATAGGVPIGGLSRAAAEEKLAEELAPRIEQDITLIVDDEAVTTTAAELGLGVDVPATVDLVGIGRKADPRHIWSVLTGGGEVAPVVTVDDATLEAYLADLAEQVHRDPVDAKVAIKKEKVAYTKSVQARDLDVAGSAAAIKDAFLAADQVTLPFTLTDPAVTDEQAKEARQIAKKIVSGPVVLQVKGVGTYKVPVSDLAKSYRFEVKDGALVAVLDGDKLFELSKSGLSGLATTKPVDAKVEIRDGKPHVVPSKDGNEIDQKTLVKAVEESVGKSGKGRTSTVSPNGKKAEYTTEDAKKAGVKEIVSEYTTNFPYAEYRNVNLSVAAGLINNAYLKPGDQFSLNERIGERTRAKGFVDGSFIENGRLVQGLAGGISQSATTVFNAAFFGGVQLDQWQPHTLYFDRYPAGRESTVYLPTIDVKFTNNTPYGMVVQAFVSKASPGGQGSITVRLWSTKHFTVESPEPTKSGFYSGTTRYVDTPDCTYQAPIQGFTAKYHRIIRTTDGKLVKREDYSWKYSAGDEIRCGKPPSDDDDED